MGRISTSLVEFEESPEIKAFFELDGSDAQPRCLFIVLEDRLLASLEIIKGSLDEDIDLILERSIEFEVNALGGYISKLDEAFPDDIMTIFKVDNVDKNQYHFFKYSEFALSAHLSVLSDWHEQDLDKYRKFLDGMKLCESNFEAYELGEILEHQNFEASIGYKIGVRTYLGNQLVTIV